MCVDRVCCKIELRGCVEKVLEGVLIGCVDRVG